MANILQTRRIDSRYYDGPGELTRESVLAVWGLISKGGEFGNAEIGDRLGYEHNTVEKALRILAHHGYAECVRYSSNKTRSGQIAIYRAVLDSPFVNKCKQILEEYPEGHNQRDKILEQIKTYKGERQ